MDTDLRHRLINGQADVPRVGRVVESPRIHLPYLVLDANAEIVQPTTPYLTELALCDSSPLTVRSYAFDLLRWFRLLWFLDQPWETATEADTAAMVGWLRATANPQRRRRTADSPAPGSVNIRTGKPHLPAGYQPATINHALTVVSSFYAHHARSGQGPVINPVPASQERRQALAHRNPDEPIRQFRRARLRQREADALPRAIPDAMWDELIDAMSCDRDRALLLFYVTSGARASELLGITLADIDWSQQQIYVVSKGTRLREPVPASPLAFVLLGKYLDEAGPPAADLPVWRTRRGEQRPLTYWAMRRILQRANTRLGTNWTLHDMRHTAATRMANDPNLTITEVRTILRHANISTTNRYLHARLEDLFNKLQAHYGRPRVEATYAAGYDPEDIKAVFGAC